MSANVATAATLPETLELRRPAVVVETADWAYSLRKKGVFGVLSVSGIVRAVKRVLSLGRAK
jgi:hypothetical protein